MPKIKIRFPLIEYKEKILTISDEFLHKFRTPDPTISNQIIIKLAS